MRRWKIGFWLLMLAHGASAQDSLWLARTTGPFPFMEYGIGDDRLGGAKMSYLDSNILVRIVDSFGMDYKVRLSNQHYAYIAKASLIRQTRVSNHPVVHNPHLSGSIKVFNKVPRMKKGRAWVPVPFGRSGNPILREAEGNGVRGRVPSPRLRDQGRPLPPPDDLGEASRPPPAGGPEPP